jgi:hypothetical protein
MSGRLRKLESRGTERREKNKPSDMHTRRCMRCPDMGSCMMGFWEHYGESLVGKHFSR